MLRVKTAVKTIEAFRALRDELLRKWGDKLVAPTSEELRAITTDCEPLARYAKMPPARIHNALARQVLGLQ